MSLLQFLVPLLVLPLVLATAVVWQKYVTDNFDFQCGNCGRVFSLTVWQGLAAPHMMWRKLIRCPRCGQMAWVTPVPKRYRP